jgi:hypothetical protein
MKIEKRILLWEKDEIDIESDMHDLVNEMNDEDEDEIHYIKTPKQLELINTNFGLFDANSPDNPYNSRDIWVAHTNFDIEKDDVLKISEIDGVEGIRILTRYSFTVMIGVMFYFEDVLDAINKELRVENEDFNEPSPEESTKLLKENNEIVQEKLKKVAEHKFWHLYIFPNGKDIMNIYETEELRLELEPFYNNLKSISEGILLSSHDA